MKYHEIIKNITKLNLSENYFSIKDKIHLNLNGSNQDVINKIYDLKNLESLNIKNIKLNYSYYTILKPILLLPKLKHLTFEVYNLDFHNFSKDITKLLEEFRINNYIPAITNFAIQGPCLNHKAVDIYAIKHLHKHQKAIKISSEILKSFNCSINTKDRFKTLKTLEKCYLNIIPVKSNLKIRENILETLASNYYGIAGSIEDKNDENYYLFLSKAIEHSSTLKNKSFTRRILKDIINHGKGSLNRYSNEENDLLDNLILIARNNGKMALDLANCKANNIKTKYTTEEIKFAKNHIISKFKKFINNKDQTFISFDQNPFKLIFSKNGKLKISSEEIHALISLELSKKSFDYPITMQLLKTKKDEKYIVDEKCILKVLNYAVNTKNSLLIKNFNSHLKYNLAFNDNFNIKTSSSYDMFKKSLKTKSLQENILKELKNIEITLLKHNKNITNQNSIKKKSI